MLDRYLCAAFPFKRCLTFTFIHCWPRGALNKRLLIGNVPKWERPFLFCALINFCFSMSAFLQVTLSGGAWQNLEQQLFPESSSGAPWSSQALHRHPTTTSECRGGGGSHCGWRWWEHPVQRGNLLYFPFSVLFKNHFPPTSVFKLSAKHSTVVLSL